MDPRVLKALTQLSAIDQPELRLWCSLLEVRTRLGLLDFNQMKFPLPEVIEEKSDPDNPGQIFPTLEHIKQCYVWAARVIDAQIFEKLFAGSELANCDKLGKMSVRKLWIYDSIAFEWGLEFEDFVRNPDARKDPQIINFENKIAQWIH